MKQDIKEYLEREREHILRESQGYWQRFKIRALYALQGVISGLIDHEKAKRGLDHE